MLIPAEIPAVDLYEYLQAKAQHVDDLNAGYLEHELLASNFSLTRQVNSAADAFGEWRAQAGNRKRRQARAAAVHPDPPPPSRVCVNSGSHPCCYDACSTDIHSQVLRDSVNRVNRYYLRISAVNS